MIDSELTEMQEWKLEVIVLSDPQDLDQVSTAATAGNNSMGGRRAHHHGLWKTVLSSRRVIIMGFSPQSSRPIPGDLCPPHRGVQNAILVVLLTWTIVVTLCDDCTFTPLEATVGNQPKGCSDAQGVFHYLHSTWRTDNCEICDCLEQGMECCSITMRAVGYDENQCEEVFDRWLCLFKAVKKENPSQHCEVSEYVH
ncbi:beta-microseminoprotein A1-like [Gracilinanus agilis]|uniref:beta-microseminoprotein A1-like n=1 Tax=Gracilinanus agilis TaxID=191870 RepID=UPI001CFEF357|nr:beta-microseminoprotein A1-like [Gracilinanus agilis]